MKHPSKALLERHALGDLPLPVWIAVDAHVESCAECDQVIAAAEEVEGKRLSEAAPIDVSSGMLERIMASLEERPAVPPQTPSRLGDVTLPRAVADAGVGARRWLGPELWTAFVDAPNDDGWRAFVLRAPPGAVVPVHGHEGPEIITVLAGSLVDGARYSAGDFVEVDAEHEHALRAGRSGPCVCLIALQGNYKWRGLARIFAPILGV